MKKFFVTCLLCVASFLQTNASAQVVVPHCSPDCSACPSCSFCDAEPSCTLTQGFWKNHTECWPAVFDPGIQKICMLLWIDILNTPVMGRPWYNLAHQWIAAKLNQANGVDTSCIDCTLCSPCTGDVLAFAENLLNNNSCADVNDKTPPDATLYNCLAMLLDDFNMGMLSGCPEHCGGENPCNSCDCGLCCPFDCNMCVDCENICELAQMAGCSSPCNKCECDCTCHVNVASSSSSSSSSSHSHHHHH